MWVQECIQISVHYSPTCDLYSEMLTDKSFTTIIPRQSSPPVGELTVRIDGTSSLKIHDFLGLRSQPPHGPFTFICRAHLSVIPKVSVNLSLPLGTSKPKKHLLNANIVPPLPHCRYLIEGGGPGREQPIHRHAPVPNAMRACSNERVYEFSSAV
ncbi:hypothetical protein BS17DRAFT_778016 [Gyrodon lividus]|nr:hypothetical protein BS17DRAFT_778016 [Gyrodon lividus]